MNLFKPADKTNTRNRTKLRLNFVFDLGLPVWRFFFLYLYMFELLFIGVKADVVVWFSYFRKLSSKT